MYCTFLIMFSVGLLTFMLSAPTTHSTRNTPNTPQDHEPDEIKPDTRTPIQLQTNVSKCPNLAVLDGLRVIFISLIIKAHFDFKTDPTSLAGNGGMQYFTILVGFIRVVTAKEPDPTTPVGKSLKHHIARIITRFSPAYYLALTWTMMQERENVSVIAPVQASFFSGFVSDGAMMEIGKQCAHVAKDLSACYTFFGHSWFVADVFVLVMLFPVFDKIPKIV
jgi:peptidoglycan/LPS O-acetylase OafA/YrhL